ncbi:MAG: ABC transporter ATP-binding protein [Candidatus Omnitrophota bacterium]
MSEPLLKIENLSISIQEKDNDRELLKDFNFEIKNFETVALVGGSGSGKTTAGLSILQLLSPAMRIDSGRIIFNGKDLLAASLREMRKIRGKEIGVVFQDPLNAFNPVFTIGFQIEEVLRFHEPMPGRQRREKVHQLLNRVGITEPQRIARSYPHQLSGGLRQRAMIAQAIAGSPKLIIADEPTSSLDVTLQAHIIELFRDLKNEFKTSILLITHDLGMVEHFCDRVGVLYDGRIVEEGCAKDILSSAKHPLTCELINASKG